MTEYEILNNILIGVNALNYKISFIIALTLFVLVLFIISFVGKLISSMFD